MMLMQPTRQLAALAGLTMLVSAAPIGGDRSVRASHAVQEPAVKPRQDIPGTRRVEPDEYRIGPEDVLDITVWKSAELTRTVPVRPDGKITLPLLNDVQAAAITPMQLRDTLAKGYADYLSSPEVSVIVREIHSLKVSVVGRVKTPGRYELKAQATVLEALAMAGGLTDFAKGDRIVIFRRVGKGWTKLPFSYTKVVAEWDEHQNIVLEPGDIVIVP